MGVGLSREGARLHPQPLVSHVLEEDVHSLCVLVWMRKVPQSQTSGNFLLLALCGDFRWHSLAGGSVSLEVAFENVNTCVASCTLPPTRTNATPVSWLPASGSRCEFSALCLLLAAIPLPCPQRLYPWDPNPK